MESCQCPAILTQQKFVDFNLQDVTLLLVMKEAEDGFLGDFPPDEALRRLSRLNRLYLERKDELNPFGLTVVSRAIFDLYYLLRSTPFADEAREILYIPKPQERETPDSPKETGVVRVVSFPERSK
ncbi:MAG: hypothetical protein Q8P25_05015 [Candidatus Curtissbacteria bacterium]|nr:hypothetical protein [Candidatus Curtissbacteria bacterium]